MASLRDEQKQAVRFALGYPGVEEGSLVLQGATVAYAFYGRLEHAMDHLHAVAVPIVERILGTLADIESRMTKDALDDLRVRAVDEVEMNTRQLDVLQSQYVMWAKRLADTFGVPLAWRSYLSTIGPATSGSVPRRV